MKVSLWLVVLVLLAAPATAFMNWDEPIWVERELVHIFQDGTYGDLREFRKDLGYEVLPWIDSLSDFSRERQRVEDILDEYEKERIELVRYRRSEQSKATIIVRNAPVTLYKPDLSNPNIVHVITYPQPLYTHTTVPRKVYVNSPYREYQYRRQVLRYRYPHVAFR